MTHSWPQAILFDMDDTILAYNVLDAAVWREVCALFAPRLAGIDTDALVDEIQEFRRWYWNDPTRHRHGRLNPDLARLDLVQGAFERLGLDDGSLAAEIADAHGVRRDKQVQPIDGALDTLRQLREFGVRLGLVTNGNAENQRRKVDRFSLGPLFDHVLIEGEFGLGKPDDRVYLHTLDRLGAQPADSWMVGDNLEWEVAAPQRLGMYGVWVDSTGKGVPDSSEVRPDRIIAAVPELLET